MKHLIFLLTIMVAAIVVMLSCTTSEENILDRYPEAKARLQSHIDACGPGVVEGKNGENRCLYTIKVDAMFLVPMEERTGLVKPQGWENERPYVSLQKRNDVMEEVKKLAEWDWSKQRGGICGTRNQGSCGSCWLFSTFKTWRDWHKLAHPETECLDIAHQWGIDCSPDDFSGCGGGWWSDGKVKLGAVYTPNYSPYYARNRRCLSSKVEYDEKTKAEETIYVGEERGQAPTTHEILAAIYEYGPVSITEAAFNAGHGIYNRCRTTSSTNHMTELYGWVWLDGKGNKVQAGDGTLYFYRHNSWATEDPEVGRRTVQATPYDGFEALETTRRCQNMGRTTVAIADGLGGSH